MATSRICSVANCGKPRRKGEWCGAHYMRWRRHGDPLGGGAKPGPPKAAPISCSVVGCNKQARAGGLCYAHWHRKKKHGDPLKGRTAEGEPLTFYLNSVLRFDGTDCLIWPFGRDADGYAQVWSDRRKHYVHKMACEASIGPRPTTKHEVAHSCGNGRRGCVNPRHLRWATHAENMADTLVHQTNGRKLTANDVWSIRGLLATRSNKAIATLFHVAPSSISHIRTGHTWAHVK